MPQIDPEAFNLECYHTFKNMSSPERQYYNAFNLMPQIGPMRFRLLLSRFPSLRDAWEAGFDELKDAGLDDKLAKLIIEHRKRTDPDLEYEKLERENIRIITQHDDAFPRYLSEIASSPVMLYVRGGFVAEEFCISIVGSRKISEYGKRTAEDFARGLSRGGATLVSGMAYGVDTIVHRECLKQGHRTIAVLGSGLDEKSIYPASNRELGKEIENCGCILSEYPIGTPPLKQHFPARNRLVSGISRGVLVIEASLTSGSLITARFALEQNREVFAVPGSVYSKNSEGTNNLIKMGAKSACNISDILEEFNVELSPAAQEMKRILPDSPEEALVLEHLSSDEPLHVDKLALATGIKTAQLSSLLTLMEIKGMIKEVGGMRYVKR